MLVAVAVADTPHLVLLLALGVLAALVARVVDIPPTMTLTLTAALSLLAARVARAVLAARLALAATGLPHRGQNRRPYSHQNQAL